MRKTGILLIAMTALCLADAGVLDFVEPILGTPVVATSMGYMTGVLAERGWTQIEADEKQVTADYVGDGRDEHLTFTFTPAASTPDEPSEASYAPGEPSYAPGKTHQDILTVDYTYVPWLEIEGGAQRARAEFDRLIVAFDYLIGPGETEATDAGVVHTWPGRDMSRIELILAPMYSTRLTVWVNLVPLREPESD
ncbi:MAG: hypothetical protein NTW26_07650 [bacterium]|nr:hypothetical protein [bacterium]